MSARGRLLRWGSWFAVVNAALLGIVGLRYLWYYSALTPSVAWVYAVLAYVGQLTALGYLPFLLLVPLMLLVPRPRVILLHHLRGGTEIATLGSIVDSEGTARSLVQCDRSKIKGDR